MQRISNIMHMHYIYYVTYIMILVIFTNKLWAFKDFTSEAHSKKKINMRFFETYEVSSKWH